MNHDAVLQAKVVTGAAPLWPHSTRAPQRSIAEHLDAVVVEQAASVPAPRWRR